jgi:hypothetical protein
MTAGGEFVRLCEQRIVRDLQHEYSVLVFLLQAVEKAVESVRRCNIIFKRMAGGG